MGRTGGHPGVAATGADGGALAVKHRQRAKVGPEVAPKNAISRPGKAPPLRRTPKSGLPGEAGPPGAILAGRGKPRPTPR